MTDRELLEMAAKAAGYERNSAGPVGPCEWNPLTNDGDALRLSVILGIDVWQYRLEKKVESIHGHDGFIVEHYGDDPYAATRRAIVRAAAEIGRGME